MMVKGNDTAEQERLLLLIRAGLGDDIAGAFPEMSISNWQKVLEMATIQNVLPIIYDGVKRYHAEFGLDCPQAIKFSLYATMQQAEWHYDTQLQAIQSLTSFFTKHGVRTMVLKGYALSLCYPNPMHRPCGDIDIYQFGDYKRADALIESNFGKIIDRGHHHHTVYRWKGVMVENHYDFVNIHAHKSSAWLEKHFKQLANESCEQVGDVYLPSPNLHALFLLRHAGAHFAGEKITLRHLLDWYLFCKKYAPVVDWAYVRRCAKESGCERFMDCLQVCCDRMMGKPCAINSLAERMWNDILQPDIECAEKNNLRKYIFKARRWWRNRWKHRMVYRENLASQLVTLTLSHIINPKGN